MNIELIEQYCLQYDLSTYDPYDIWQTKIGRSIKNLYNTNKYIGLLPAGLLTLFDMFFKGIAKLTYKKNEYPIVRALAVQSLLNLYVIEHKEIYLKYAKNHIDWLLKNTCKGYSGYCWGLGFKYPVLKGLVYDKNTPLSTMTPYVLEALHMYNCVVKDASINKVILSIYDFLENDLKVMYEDEDVLATSYGPLKDRTVVNSVSYTLYCYSLLSHYYLTGENKTKANSKIVKLFNFIKNNQNKNGSWFYSTDGGSFIDCFHSCFVVKNIIKSNLLIPLDGSDLIIKSSYKYIKESFNDDKYILYKRFSVSNKIGLVKVDLYDNAEMFNLAVLLNDMDLAENILINIKDTFFENGVIYSQIDLIDRKLNADTLRWAVLPFIYALSTLLIKRNEN